MRLKHSVILITSLCLFCLPFNSFAEVFVVNDSNGNYLKILSSFSEKHGRIFYWEPETKKIPLYLMLNIEGDNLGDGKPTIAEHPLSKHPIVFWSRSKGKDHDIVYSFWNGHEWSQSAAVLQSEEDDTEPSAAYDSTGTLYLVFTRKAETTQIYLMKLINGRWQTPILISDPAMNCSSPTLIFYNGLKLAAFQTPYGITIIDLGNIIIDEGPDPFPNLDSQSIATSSPYR